MKIKQSILIEANNAYAKGDHTKAWMINYGYWHAIVLFLIAFSSFHSVGAASLVATVVGFNVIFQWIRAIYRTPNNGIEAIIVFFLSGLIMKYFQLMSIIIGFTMFWVSIPTALVILLIIGTFMVRDILIKTHLISNKRIDCNKFLTYKAIIKRAERNRAVELYKTKYSNLSSEELNQYLSQEYVSRINEIFKNLTRNEVKLGSDFNEIIMNADDLSGLVINEEVSEINRIVFIGYLNEHITSLFNETNRQKTKINRVKDKYNVDSIISKAQKLKDIK